MADEPYRLDELTQLDEYWQALASERAEVCAYLQRAAVDGTTSEILDLLDKLWTLRALIVETGVRELRDGSPHNRLEGKS